MSRFAKTQADFEWPKGEDRTIALALTQTRVQVLATLAGAGAGLYVMLTGNGLVYLGPFVGICGVYELVCIIFRVARSLGATHWQTVRKE